MDLSLSRPRRRASGDDRRSLFGQVYGSNAPGVRSASMAHDIAALDADLNQLIATGKAMDAFEKYYAEDCVMQENLDPPRTGKAACRDYEIGFFSSIAEFKRGEMLSAAVTGDRSFSEWVFACTFKDGSAMDNTQVSVRTWKDGKVVYERFYYKANFTPAS